MREDLRHFIDTSMNGTNATYKLLGDGITSLTEEFNVEEESKQYINQSFASNHVKSYMRSFQIDKEDCASDALQAWIDSLVDYALVGSKAETTYIRLRLTEAGTASGSYRAFKIPCTVSVVSSGGDAGDFVHNVLSIKQCGAPVQGEFNVATATFTAGSTPVAG